MKLHLPVKLRASLIAAVIAVPALVYNAFAGENYTAPSDAFGWDNNDIEFTAKLMETAGNTYTAREDVKYALYDGTNKPVGLIEENGTTVELTYDAASGKYLHPTEVDTEGNPILVTPTAYKVEGTDGTPAEIIVATKDYEKVSYLAGDTTMDADSVDIRNSLASVTEAAGSATPYAGDVSITTDDLKVSTDNTRVVLEDANVEVSGTTTVSDDSQLVILNGTGAADQFSTVEQGLLGIAGIPVNDVNDGDSKTVALGAVSGGGSVTVIGDGSNVAASMDSVYLTGSLNLGDADASVSGDVKATEIALVGSATDVDGDVTFDGIVVDADSVLDATGNVSNAAHGGAGYVDVAGEVYADGNVFLDNGKADKDLGIKDGAVVDAGGDATLRNVDAVKADQITADGDLTLVSGSTIEGLKETDGRTDNISAGGDLVVGDGSSIKDAEISVGGNVVVSNDAPGLSVGSLDSSSITNTDITVTPTGTSNVTINGGSSMTSSSIVGANGQIDITDDSTVTDSLIDMDPDATDGVNHDLTVSDSTVTNSSILDVDGSATVTNSELDKVTVTVATDTTAAPSDVTLANSSMTDSSITGGTGDITVDDSTVTVTDESGATRNFIGADKENLAGILEAAGATTPLTGDSLADKGLTVGSVIGNTSGNVTITDSSVDSTLVTGGGDITIADTENTPDASQAIANVKDIIADALANPVDGAVVVPYVETNAEFGTVVDGSIIDVRGNLGETPTPENDLTVDSAALTNSVLLGVTGKITVSDSLLGNDYIDGGSGIEIDNSVIVDTDIVNMNADIVLKDNISIISTDEDKPFVMTTKGTAEITDYDEYTGGSIILEGADLQNGVIKSGVTAERNADGTYTYTPTTSATDAMVDDGTGSLTSLGTKLPYGQIKVTDSALNKMDISTVAGAISVTDSSVAASAISTGSGDVTLAGTNATAPGATETPYTRNDNCGGITGFKTSLNTLGASGATKLTSISVMERTGSGAQPSGVYLRVTDSLGNVVATSTNAVTFANAAAMQTFEFADVSIDPAEEYTFSFVNANGDSVGVQLGLTNNTADGIKALHPSENLSNHTAIVEAGYLAPSTDATAEGWTPANTVVDSTITTGAGNIAVSKTLVDSSDVTTGAGNIGITTSKVVDSNIISEGAGDVRIEAASLVETSVVSTVEGNVTITGASSVLGSDVSTEDGALSVNGSTVNSVTADGTLDKSTLTATDDSNIINGSYVSGTDITISDTDGDGVAPGLDIYGNALTTVEGDVNMAVDGRIYVNTNGKLALDGDKEGDNTRDASVTADSLVLNDIYDKQASIANAQVAVTTKTMLKDGNTLTLDSVNSAEGESAGTLGDLLQMGDPDVQDNNGNWSEAGITTVAIKGGSILEAGRIGVVTYASQGGDSVETADVTNAHNYFDKITVVEDSKVTASGKALVNTLHVNVDQADTTTAGSKVTFEQDAYLTNAQIRGEGEKTYLGSNQDGPEVTIKGNGHVGNLRMDNEGAISFVGDGTQKSYIADIAPAINGEVHGVINVVNGELVTPVLNHGNYLSLGLNGGVVTLDSVTAEQGATIASTDAVNAHVKLDLITNASQTGAPDVTPLGQSTIKTTLNRVEVPYNYTEGTPTETIATTYYYKVMSDTTAAAETTVQRWNGTALETVTVAAGEKLKSGDIITKTDKALTYFTKADGSTVANGVTTSDAAVLTPAEESYLVRITVPLVDAEGNLRYEETELGTALVVGQTVTQNTLSYQDGVAESGGTITEMTDGIASLTVLEDMDSDNTVINAYETGRYTYYAADGTVLDPATATPEELAAATKSVVVDANSGYINIQGALTGQDNQLYADNNISINGITADADNRDYENANSITSGRGDITVGGSGVFGSGNSLTAQQGSVTTNGVKGNDNTLTAGDEVQINGIVAGNDNTITAGTYVNITRGIGTVDDETSDGNTVLAQNGDVTLGEYESKSIHGNENTITAEQGDITMSGKILGDENILTAGAVTDAEGNITDGGNISGTSVEGNKNQLLADAAITLTGSVKGDENVLNAGTSIAVTGNIEGNKNDLDAGTTISTADIIGDENTLDAGESITTAAIAGNKNALTAGTSIETADITGDENVLNAGTSIETGAIAGNKNDLDAGTTITTEDITGDENTLDAGESITTGSIAGDKNALTAGTSIATDDITGNENELEAGTSIDTGSVTGNDNLLTAKDGDVTIDGNLDGAGNIVSSEKQNIVVTGDVIGGAAGTPNSLTAAGAVSIEGNLGGVGTDVTAYANGLGQDDVAISVGSFNAQGTDLTIATTNDATYGYASGNGSIIIGSMNAVDGAVDSALVNNIISNNSYVQIGAMNGYEAYTNITAAKDVIVGTNASTFALRAGATEQSAANQTIKGANFLIQDSVANLTLTDSTVNVTNSISGTGLTLTTTASGMMAPVFTSSANSVTLDSLEIAGNALLTATTVTLKDLTIDGTYATLVATNLTATGKLTLKNGAVFDINRVKVSGLEIENSQLDASTLVGIQELTLTNANAYISGGLTGMTGDVVLRANEEGDGSFLFTSVIDIDGALDVSGDSDAVVSGNITADKSISATGGSTISGLKITSQGAITAAGDSTITANSKLKGQSLSVDGSTVNATSVELSGALSAVNGSAVNSNVTGATDATIADSTVGNISMNGTLNATNSTVGDVTGATSATLDDADTGSISMAGDNGNITITNASLVQGNVSNAHDVTINGSKVTGTVQTDGALNAANANIQGGLTADSVVTSATISGSTISSGITSSGEVAITDKSTIIGAVSGTGVSVTDSSTGDVTATTGNATIKDSAVGDVKAENGKADLFVTTAGTVTATDAIIEGSTVSDIALSGSLEASNSTLGTVTGATSATLDDVSSGSISMAGDNGDITIENNSLVDGNVTNANDVTINGSMVTGTVQTDGALNATNANIQGGLTADSVVTSANISGSSIGSGITSSGAVTITDKSTISGAVSGTDVSVSDSSTGDVTADGAVSVENAQTGTLDGATVSTKEATVNGSVNADTAATLTGGTVSGNVEVTDGAATITGTEITGTVTADSVAMTGGTAGDVTADNGDATIGGGAEVGDVTASGTVSVENAQTGTLDGAVVNTNGATVIGNVEADTAASLTGGSVSGNVNVTDGAATITGTEITGTVQAGSVEMTGGKADDVTALSGNATIDGAAVVGDVTAAAGTATIIGSVADTVNAKDVVLNNAVTETVTATDSASITGGTVAGDVKADTVTMDGATITQNVIAGTSATLTGGSVGADVTVTGDNGIASISGTVVSGNVTADYVQTQGADIKGEISIGKGASFIGGTVTDDVVVNDGDVLADGTTFEGSVSADDVTIKDGVAGDITADEIATVIGSSVGDVSGATVVIKESESGNVTSTGGATVADSTVNGNVNAKTDSSIMGGSVSGNVVISDGVATITGTEIAGTVNADSVDMTGGKAGNVTADNGDATIDGGAVVGDVTAANKATLDNATAGTVSAKDVALNSATTGAVTATDTATISGGSVSGDVTATTATITDAEIAGNVEATTADITGGKAGNVTATDATIDGGAVVGNVTATGTVDVANAQTGAVSGSAVSLADASTGAVTAETLVATGTVAAEGTVTADSMTVTDGTLTADAVTVSGVASISSASVTAQTLQAASVSGDDAVINASITAGDVTLKDSTAKDMTMTGKLVAAGSSIGSVSGASSAEITGGSTGDLSVNGDVTATNGADIASISKAEDVTLAQAVTGDITASGKVTAATGTVMGDVTSGSASMSGAKAKSLSTGALSVTPEGFAADGSISADGVVSIAGSTTAGKSISLKGAVGSAISGADITAGDKLTLDGTIAAANTTLTGTNGVAVQGTLDAGKGVKFAGGAVTGTGTINKTGGDTLELAGNTDLTGGAVNVDASTLAAADGAKLGSVALKGATMSVAGSAIGSVTADNLKSDAAGTLETNVDLAARKADTTVVSGKVDLNGASIAMAPTSVAAEGSVADQTRINIISGSVTSGANEDVTHSMDTLNAHIENTADGVDLVLSKNYKGAENKTQNQSATADALASINPVGVPADSPLADVLEALGHTRSEADAKLALDSLSGAGLAGLQKAIAEDAKEHMQTLRATMKALNADVQRRYDENGIIPGVQSSAISASVTGGTAELSGDENCGDYTRSSFGGMVAMAHALYNGWTFGSSFAFSYADAECGDVNMDGEFIYVDLAMMHKGKRLSQTGTIGASFINFDTERDVRVNAPGHSFAGRAEGSTSAVAINMSYEMAYDLIKSDDGHRLGSVVMAEATFAQIDGMTESGLGNAGVNAEFDDVASLTFGIGARYTYEFGAKDNPGYFNLDVMAVAEAGDNTPKVNNMFIGGGQTYELVGPEAGTIGLRLNAGVLLPIGQQTGIFGNVTSEFRSEQTSVGGSVGVKYSF